MPEPSSMRVWWLLIAAVGVAEERLAAVAAPFDGTAGTPRRPQHEDVLAIQEIAGPESAAKLTAELKIGKSQVAEMCAFTTLAQVLMNLDEFMTRE